MSTNEDGPWITDNLHPDEGWGDIPPAERWLWTRYMNDHKPWFPGGAVWIHVMKGVMNGRTRAPRPWKEHAQALRNAGFTPTDFYLLSELLWRSIDTLDESRHSDLFEQWLTDDSRGPRWLRIKPEAWVPWLDMVRIGESPRGALAWVLDEHWAFRVTR